MIFKRLSYGRYIRHVEAVHLKYRSGVNAWPSNYAVSYVGHQLPASGGSIETVSLHLLA